MPADTDDYEPEPGYRAEDHVDPDGPSPLQEELPLDLTAGEEPAGGGERSEPGDMEGEAPTG